MLETAKYIDGDNFVVIYKNFTKMTTEERIHLMEAINGAEMFPAAGVEPDTGKVEIKSLDDFTTRWHCLRRKEIWRLSGRTCMTQCRQWILMR